MIIPKAFHTRCTETNAQNLNNIKHSKGFIQGLNLLNKEK